MKVVRESNENEVVLNFLTGELQSERFNIKLKKTLKLQGLATTPLFQAFTQE